MFHTLNVTIVGVKELSTLDFLKAATLQTKNKKTRKQIKIKGALSQKVKNIALYHSRCKSSILSCTMCPLSNGEESSSFSIWQ